MFVHYWPNVPFQYQMDIYPSTGIDTPNSFSIGVWEGVRINLNLLPHTPIYTYDVHVHLSSDTKSLSVFTLKIWSKSQTPIFRCIRCIILRCSNPCFGCPKKQNFWNSKALKFLIYLIVYSFMDAQNTGYYTWKER